jgi:hypothetical protein
MLAAIAVLHLVVHDANTGLLYDAERAMPSYANTIEACRKTGVERAKRLACEYHKTYPAASANVDCEWRRGFATGDPA